MAATAGRASAAALALVCLGSIGLAQQQPQQPAPQTPSPFGLDLLRGAITDDPGRSQRPPAPPPQSAEPASGPTGQVTLIGLVSEESQQRIEKGLVWRVFGARGADGKPRVTGTYREASPVLQLAPGEYLVNVAFGRANVTRRITVQPGGREEAKFPLNVGLLKITAMLGTQPAPANSVMIEVLSDERDQFGQRVKVVTGSRPGRQFRLNSGLYQIISVYGDANATVQADLTVEPGKLTEATVMHQAARVTFRLVRRAGGEAIADTQWSIINRQGDTVKESAGALPSHLLAPGTYTVSARSQGQVYRRTFAVRHGEATQVEVMAQ